eukprot:CAMPEP_0171330322 /NCGR_PEP_ID=MMETSP0878-20121228/1930_1 /TAXON_ID=67004 /ORGANISM="Thalassiosira weissflogii, Strain CCMP1336" /LENGTH=761 /DNA_ID=CAMNT_0011830595 /DNA_START=460 /DNA_END=2745 /DNA_ORIENTATION=+
MLLVSIAFMILSPLSPPLFVQSQSLFLNDSLGSNLGTVSEEMVISSNLPSPSENGLSDANPNIADAQNVVGIVFDVHSKSNVTVYITGLEFYTSMKGSLFYEIYTKKGKYNEAGTLGDLSFYTPISSGLVMGPGPCIYEDSSVTSGLDDSVATLERTSLCPMAVIPKEGFMVDGAGDSIDTNSTEAYSLSIPVNGTKTFYVTLASANLLVRPIATTNSFDTTVVASTSHLDIHDGVASLTYPFSTNPDLFHDGKMSFIGSLHYKLEIPGRTDVPSAMPSMVTSSPPSGNSTTIEGNGPNQFGSLSPTTTTHPTTAPPTISLVPSISTIPTSMPSKPPFLRCRPGRPCLPPPTPPPSESPGVDPTATPPHNNMTIELIVTMENVPERIMIEREVEQFEDVITEWFQNREEFKTGGVYLNRTELMYHNMLYPKVKEMKQSSPSRVSSRGKARKLPVRDDAGAFPYDLSDGDSAATYGNVTSKEDMKSRENGPSRRKLDTGRSFVYTYNTQLAPNSKYTFKPKKYPAIYVFTKLEIMSSLPYDIVTFFVWNQFTTHEHSLLELYHVKSLFVSYFRDVSSITVQMVDGLTLPPTISPTKASDALIVAEQDEGDKPITYYRDNLYQYVGIAIGIIWIFLTLITLRYIAKHRKKQRKRRKLTALQDRTIVQETSSVVVGHSDHHGHEHHTHGLSRFASIFKIKRLSSLVASEHDEEDEIRTEEGIDDAGDGASEEYVVPKTRRPFHSFKQASLIDLDNHSIGSHSIA